MKETLICYKTAALAKECGFDWECREFYNVNKEIKEFEYFMGNGTGWDKNSTCLNNDYFQLNIVYIAPTQSFLQKWIRAIHNYQIIITPVYDDGSILYRPEVFDNREEYLDLILQELDESKEVDFYNTFEESMEVALKTTLNRILALKQQQF